MANEEEQGMTYLELLMSEQAYCSFQLNFDPLCQSKADQERLTREIKDYEAVIIEAEREEITPEPIEYEAKPPEVDLVYGHPVAATGRANQVWREDIGMSLAAADELTAKTRETQQEIDTHDLKQTDPAYRQQLEAQEQTSLEQQPEPVEDLDRRAEPEKRDAATAEMFEEQGEAVEVSERQAWLDRWDAKEELAQEQSKNIGI